MLNKTIFYKIFKRCIPMKCEPGSTFNYNKGECEKIKCDTGYEIGPDHKCVGMKLSLVFPFYQTIKRQFI
jgi:hypothetical protein